MKVNELIEHLQGLPNPEQEVAVVCFIEGAYHTSTLKEVNYDEAAVYLADAE